MGWTYFLLAVGAYLLGSVSFALLVSRAMGLRDPRTYGSQNPGATNVLRSGNKVAAAATLALDVLKGFLPVAMLSWWGSRYGLGHVAMAVVGLAAFVGHVFPVFLRFRGGKGVATAAGVVLGVEPALGAIALLVWLLMAGIFRYSSLAAVVAAASLPLIYVLGQGLLWRSAPGVLVGTISVMGAVLVWRHAANIRRLIAGNESKLGVKP